MQIFDTFNQKKQNYINNNFFIWACRRKKNAASGFTLQSFFIFSGHKNCPSPKKIKKGFSLQSLTLLTVKKNLLNIPLVNQRCFVKQ